ncbi:hypothetical protein Gpo141_00002211 [Globisporangium polare]
MRSSLVRRCSASNLWLRSGLSFLAVLFIIVARLVYLNTSPWSWFATTGLTIVGLSEYILAFFFVTLECSTFTELANQLTTEGRLLDAQRHEFLREFTDVGCCWLQWSGRGDRTRLVVVMSFIVVRRLLW